MKEVSNTGETKGKSISSSADPCIEDVVMDVRQGPTADFLAYTLLKEKPIRSILEIVTAVSKVCCRAVVGLL